MRSLRLLQCGLLAVLACHGRLAAAAFALTRGDRETTQGSARALAGQERAVSKAPASSTLTFAVIGDFGVCGTRSAYELTCTAEEAVAALVHGWHPMAILTTGDNFYGSGSPELTRKDRDPYREDIASGRVFPSFGNNDWLAGGVGPLLSYYRLSTSYYKKEFSGLLTAYLLDTNPGEPAGESSRSEQALWFRAQLAASTTSWNVALNHQPPYASCQHGSHPKYRWIAAPGVDVVFSGHNHAYERLEEPDETSNAHIPYIVIGASGAPLGLGCRTVLPGQKKAIYGEFGAVKLEVSATALRATFYDIHGAPLDSVTFTKPPR